MVDIRKKVSMLCFLVGFIMCTFPLISGVVEYYKQGNAIKTHESVISKVDKVDLDKELIKAVEYNNFLYSSVGNNMSADEYNSILNISESGIMGSVDIPKIDVNLPIYHGTSEKVLSMGIGHVENSSFPVGGLNTRSVLTGHSGYPTSKLFTRLDEVIVGDMFFIRVLGDTLAYRVVDIEVILPSEVEKLNIIPNKDLVSLVTCTPYGVNSHRLIVTGERVEYDKAEYEKIEEAPMSFREVLFITMPVLVIVLSIILIVKDRKGGRVKYEN